jgi:GntR family transcriptional regulator
MDFNNKKSIYLQIADFVCEQILLKKWEDKIPSVRELAVSLEVNPNTVVKTYSFLEERNIIVMRRGIGYFLPDNARESAIDFKKHEFMTEDLPEILKVMDLLNISLEDFKQLYNERGQYEKE